MPIDSKKFRRKLLNISHTKLIALAFLTIILVGAILLTLPIASRSGVSCGFRPALFTATSATCVTGLVLYDTWVQWSGFGQVVILSLIELGGLGFMSAASLIIFLLRRKVGMRQRMVIAQAFSLTDLNGVVRLQRLVLVGSLTIEFLGAVILTLRFWPQYGLLRALHWGIFHSVSAFCNAGFDVLGSIRPGGSLAPFATDPVVCGTSMALIVVGGLGFFVWQEIWQKKSFRKLGVYSRLVLISTVVLIVGGAVGFCLLEWNNSETIGAMTTPQKLLVSTFQSVTTRTAGFASVDQAKLTEGGKGLTMFLMLIGGSSGSTAGGLKTVTFVVLLLFLWVKATGRQSVSIFHRTIPSNQVLDAMTLAGIMLVLAVFGGIFISATSPVSLTDGLYESISALATVGLTAGSTVKLSIPAQFLMIIYMYFGRVGILTLSLGFLTGNPANERFRYANTNLLIG